MYDAFMCYVGYNWPAKCFLHATAFKSFLLTSIIKRSANSPRHICLNKLAEKSTKWKHNTAKEEGTVLQRKWLEEELHDSVQF